VNTRGDRDARRVRRASTRTPSLAASLACSALVVTLARGASQPAGAVPPGMAQAVFGGGSFWSMEHVFDDSPSVQSVTVGYTGSAKNPTSERVEAGITRHVKAVQVICDPKDRPMSCGRDARLRELWHT
jgi:peptide-methionine (S)-S-oxide reductase